MTLLNTFPHFKSRKIVHKCKIFHKIRLGVHQNRPTPPALIPPIAPIRNEASTQKKSTPAGVFLDKGNHRRCVAQASSISLLDIDDAYKPSFFTPYHLSNIICILKVTVWRFSFFTSYHRPNESKGAFVNAWALAFFASRHQCKTHSQCKRHNSDRNTDSQHSPQSSMPNYPFAMHHTPHKHHAASTRWRFPRTQLEFCKKST